MKKIVSHKFIALTALVATGRLPAVSPRLYAVDGIDAQALADMAEVADGAVRDVELTLDRIKREADSVRHDLDRGYFSWSRSMGTNAVDIETAIARAKQAGELFARLFDAMFGINVQAARVIATAHVPEDANTDAPYFSPEVGSDAPGAIALAIAMQKEHAELQRIAKEAAEAARIAEAEAKKLAKLEARRARRAVS